MRGCVSERASLRANEPSSAVFGSLAHGRRIERVASSEGAPVRTAQRQAVLADIELPEFGMPTVEPLLPPSIFAERVERLRARMDERGYDRLVVWADREHSANVVYLTGFDPRFEEAVLVVGSSGNPALLVGNECFASAEAAPLPLRCLRFQDLSLPAQPRCEANRACVLRQGVWLQR